MTIDKAHGRLEERKVQTSTALNDYLEFPHVGHVFRILRTTTNCKAGKTRQEIAYGITSLQPHQPVAYAQHTHARTQKVYEWRRLESSPPDQPFEKKAIYLFFKQPNIEYYPCPHFRLGRGG